MSELKAVLEQKLQDKFEKKRPVLINIQQEIMQEANNIQDYIVPTQKMQFSISDKKIGVVLENDFMKLTPFVIGQLAAKNNIPTRYLRDLAEAKENWKQTLACQIMGDHNLNTRDNILLRSYNDTVKGYLTPKYKRFQSSFLYETFSDTVKSVGAEIIDGLVTDSKIFLEALYPTIIPIQTEKNGIVYVAAGVRLQNSDYGNGALELKTFLMNAVCTNGLVTENIFRRIHIGGDISKNVQLSKSTMINDTKAHCGYMKDAISQTLSVSNIEKHGTAILRASSTDVDLEKEIIKLPKMGMLEEEVKEVRSVLLQSREEDGVYGESTAWKYINGITAVARNSESDQRRREIEEISGKLFLKFMN